jgi:maleylpyruvate isomerase
LHATARTVDDGVVRRPSLLPGWTVGHVLSHLIGNADSMVRRLSAAQEGEIVSRYEGGEAGRAEQIEAGAHRPADELVVELIQADHAVDELFRTVPESVWDRPVLFSGDRQGPASQLIFSRWREVETHHLDLGLGYTAQDLPQALVDRWLPSLIEGLSARADPKALLAWTLGRGPAPELAAWG